MAVKQGNTNVLHIPRWYPHRGDPMLGLFVKNHIESLPDTFNNSVLFLQFVDEQDSAIEIDTQIINDVYNCTAYIRKASFRILSLNSVINLYRYFLAFGRCYRKIYRKQGKPTITHVHVLTRTGLLAFIIKVLTGAPYVITEHWTRYLPTTDSYQGVARKWLTAFVVKYAGAVMPVTANLRDAMISRGLSNEDYVVIPNVVDVDKFKPAVKAAKRDKKILVHLSCFTDKQKNISGILRVIKKLSSERNDFLLKLIGDGEDFDKMKQLSDKLQLTDEFVIFTGLKQNEELVELLSNSDLMIMFSNYENLPVVILESYACGVPVISTRVGGIHEHLHTGLGKLVEKQNEEQFLDELRSFLDNPDIYDKPEIREYAVSHFSKEVIGKSFAKVYDEVINKK